MSLLMLACAIDAHVSALPPGVLRVHVFLDDGTPVVGADVTVFAEPFVTDIEGAVEIAGLPSGDVPVSIHADGASPGQTTVTVEEGETTEAVVQLRTLRLATLHDAELGGTVRTDDGLELTFAADSLVDVNGSRVSGDLDVRYALFDTALSLGAAPGSLLAEGADGEPVQLVSNGMVDVHLSHDGVEVQPIAPVVLSFATLANEAPCGEEFGLYGFDEATGLWSGETGGRVVDDRFVASVEHFSYWNCDAPTYGKGCIDVTLLRDGEPVPRQEVGVWLSNGTAASPTTDGFGAIRIAAPQGAIVTVGVVYDAEGLTDAEQADAIWSIGPLTVPATEAGCADGGSVEVNGTDLDGDGYAIEPWGNECYDDDPSLTEACPGANTAYSGDSWGGGTGRGGGGTGGRNLDTACR